VSRKSKLHPPTEAEEDLEAEEEELEDPELAQRIDALLLEEDDPEAGLWIRFQSGQWVRIRNPDPGGQK
jgi:hypothetical protein